MRPRASGHRFLLGALGGVLAACAGVMPFVVNTRDQIRVPHERHVKADVDCVSCHETIFDSESVEDLDLPKEKKCTGCHKEEKDKCGFCHTQPDKPQTYAARERNVKMSHAKHLALEKVNEDCKVCHTKLPEPFAVAGIAPPMTTCNACHEHDTQFAKGDCKACHKDLARYPIQPVLAFSHQGNFVKNHRLEGRSGETCAQCHEQTFCGECHAKTVGRPIEHLLAERTDRNFIHRADYESRHSIEARADSSTCQRCHGQSFCQDCHTRRGLTPVADVTINPHPPGFESAVGTPEFHGKAARRDAASCAACHDQGAASNCVECHKVGGIGGTPHPASWVGRHGREEIARNAMCRYCHL